MKKVRILRIIGCIFGLMGIPFLILTCVAKSEESMFIFLLLTLVFIGVLGGGLFGAAGYIAKKYCPKCKQSLKGCAYEYVSLDTKIYKDNNGSLSTQNETVRITAECPHCGAKRRFKQTFCVVDYKKGTSYNVELKVSEFCKKLFRE